MAGQKTYIRAATEDEAKMDSTAKTKRGGVRVPGADKAAKERLSFLNAELERLHVLLREANANPEAIKWAMDRTTQLQDAMMELYSAIVTTLKSEAPSPESTEPDPLPEPTN